MGNPMTAEEAIHDLRGRVRALEALVRLLMAERIADRRHRQIIDAFLDNPATAADWSMSGATLPPTFGQEPETLKRSLIEHGQLAKIIAGRGPGGSVFR